MRAVITGASSGLGLEFAKILNKKGYTLTLIARRKDRLEKLKERFGDETQIIVADLSKTEEIQNAFSKINIDETEILINNAGFGLVGEFTETDMQKELNMIKVNTEAVFLLSKLFLKEFQKKNSGYILNVASIASFLPGPLMVIYYSTKSFVRTMTESIREELRRNNSEVYIGILCPGPVKTEFDEIAQVKFSLKSASASYVSEYAIEKMLKKKAVILPTFAVKSAVLFSRFLPFSMLSRITYKAQKRKIS